MAATGSFGTNHTASTVAARVGHQQLGHGLLEDREGRLKSAAEPLDHPVAGPVGGPEVLAGAGERAPQRVEHLVGSLELGAGEVVRPERDERAEHLVALRVDHRHLEAAGEVGGGLGAAGALGGHGEEPATQAQIDLAVHPVAVVGQLEHRSMAATEVAPCLVDRAAAAGAVAGVRVGVGRFSCAVGPLEVRGDHGPVDEVGRRIAPRGGRPPVRGPRRRCDGGWSS